MTEENELDIELNEEDFRSDIKGVSKNPRAKEIAKQEGVNIGTTRKENVLYLVIILLGIAVIVGIVAFLVLVNEDKFKTDVSVNMTCPECPDIEIPECPICENTCELECPDFPNKIEVIIKNSTS